LPSVETPSAPAADFDDPHVGAPQIIPVKLFTRKGVNCHLRQALPERSRARRLALMAPWFALGLSFGADTGMDVPFTPSLGNKISAWGSSLHIYIYIYIYIATTIGESWRVQGGVRDPKEVSLHLHLFLWTRFPSRFGYCISRYL
jgi:hypothetical protein